jgi:type II secretory pathway pseudopilin PulG
MKTHCAQAGFSLPALIFFMTAVSIAIAAAVPVYQFQAKRELEEELIFRGGEYTRAIQKYQRKFGVYPNSIEQLVSTNGLRFLRRAYKDPITGKDFRLLTINPDGSINGSKVFTKNMNAQSMFGNTQPFGTGQSNPQQPQQQTPQQNPQQPFQGGQQPFQGGQQPFQGGQQPFQGGQQPFQGGQQPFQGGQQSFQGSQPFQTPQTSQQSQTQFGQFQSAQRNQQQFGTFQGGGGTAQPGGFGGGGSQFTGFTQGQQPQRGLQQGLGTAPGTAGGQPIATGGIIGVASDSDKDSIKIYNNRQKYDEWDFVAILGQQLPGQPGVQQPGQQPNPFGGGQRQTNPFQTPTASPFGGAPTSSPFGAAPTGSPFGTNQTPQPNPFGVGNTPTGNPQK